MNARLHKFDFNWLAPASDDSISTAAQDTNIEHVKIPVPPEFGEAWIDIHHINAGFMLARGVYALEQAPRDQLVPLLEMFADYPEPTFSCQIVQGGFISHIEKNGDAKHVDFLTGSGRDIFRYQNTWHSRAFAEGGVTNKMTSILLTQSMLESFLGADMAERLLLKLGLGSATEVVVREIPAQVSAPLHEAISKHYFGSTLQLHAQAKALEYLAGLTNFVCKDCALLFDRRQGDRRQGERRHRARIKELHDHLLAFDGQLPTTSELAANFGLSARQLNNEFVAEYGKSIFAFTSDIRLEQARIALQDSAAPMKVIALRLGYSHVNHFITAFKRKFGHSPGKLRSKKPEDSPVN